MGKSLSVKQIHDELQKLASPQDAQQLQRFFKTGKGQYGEGDQFLGIRVPVLRKLAKKYNGLLADDASLLLCSIYHEERALALIMMVDRFKKGSLVDKEAVYRLYISHTTYINNWDLVDISAEHVVGAYLLDRDRSLLYSMAASENLWERRIAVMSTFHFIRKQQFSDTLAISEILLKDKHDLIHKATGWMLREIGKRDQDVEETFLKKHYLKMPRTMLRYAIEKFPEEKRLKYLAGEIWLT